MYEFSSRPFLATGDPSSGAVPAPGDTDSELGPARIIDELEATIARFDRLVANRSSEELSQAAQDGRWGIVEILSHLQDWETVFHERVRRILKEDRPWLEDYDDSLWAIEHDYGSQDGHDVFARFSDQREALVSRLRTLETEDWERTADFAGRGEITLRWLLQWLVEHDIRHFGQARDVFG